MCGANGATIHRGAGDTVLSFNKLLPKKGQNARKIFPRPSRAYEDNLRQSWALEPMSVKSGMKFIAKRNDFEVSADDGDVPTSEEPHKESITRFEGDLRQTFALQQPLSKSDGKLLAN